MHVYFLHGNLQTPAVWDFAREALPCTSSAMDLLCAPADSMSAWAKGFCVTVRESGMRDNVLVGYSMGGRLAMQALAEAPGMWSGALLVGAHPGSEDPNQRAAWLRNDLYWAERFRSEPWGKLLAEWDAQGIFGGQRNPCPPQEADFSREAVVRTFAAYSKGRQPFLLPALQRLSTVPILYLSGEKDAAYRQQGEALAQELPCLEHRVVPGAGHRVPWEKPEAFLKITAAFLSGLASVQSGAK